MLFAKKINAGNTQKFVHNTPSPTTITTVTLYFFVDRTSAYMSEA